MSKNTDAQNIQSSTIQKKIFKRHILISLLCTISYSILLGILRRYTSLIDSTYIYYFLMIFGTSGIVIYRDYYNKH